MRIGIIGDVHAEDENLAAALDALAGLAVDILLCVGDVVDGSGSVDACCELLSGSGAITVSGNHDRWLLSGQARGLAEATHVATLSRRSLEFLGSLPRTFGIATPMGPLLLCHGLGSNDMASVGEDDFGYAIEANLELLELIRGPYRFVVNGHTHRYMVRVFDGLTVINAGTLKTEHQPGFLVADFSEGSVLRFDLLGHSARPSRTWQVSLEK